MQTIHPAARRGDADHGWLKSRHTFSFANFYDPSRMGFGHLRVINEDRVTPGRGFGRHGHRNMEIISYVIDGALAHRDTIGTDGRILPGEVKIMSAGRGIQHSEMNASADDPVHFLQIWVLPNEAGGDPRYDQRDFGTDPGLKLVVSPDGRDGSLTMKQDADLWRLLLPKGDAATFEPKRNRVWVQVVHGELDVSGTRLRAGDGLAIEDPSTLEFTSHDDVNALVFDLL
jgi:redox-sensitive bicupin YhaK (pirin superfamily)